MVCLPPSKPSHLSHLTETFYGDYDSPSPRALLADKIPAALTQWGPRGLLLSE